VPLTALHSSSVSSVSSLQPRSACRAAARPTAADTAAATFVLAELCEAMRSRFHRSSSSSSGPASSGAARCSAARSESSPSTREPGKIVLDRDMPGRARTRAGSAVHSAAWDQAAGRGGRDGGESWQARSHRDQSTSASRLDRVVATGHRRLLKSSRVTPASIAHGLRMSSSCEVPHRMARPASRSTVSLRPMACTWSGREARYLGAGSTQRVRAGSMVPEHIGHETLPVLAGPSTPEG